MMTMTMDDDDDDDDDVDDDDNDDDDNNNNNTVLNELQLFLNYVLSHTKWFKSLQPSIISGYQG